MKCSRDNLSLGSTRILSLVILRALKCVLCKSRPKHSGHVQDTPALSIGRPKDKKNDDSVSLQRALEPHYIHKVDGKD